ncbi:hypothetical protein [Solitalea canadensis]|nr:hypothetical protein [Solitalea canadensis]
MKRFLFICRIIGLIVVACIMFWGRKYMDNLVINDFDKFNSSAIKGKIEKIEIVHHMSSFTILETNERYVFAPYTSDLNENNSFDLFAKKGDLVVKKSYSDTLKLIKGNKTYLYTFRKINQ